MSFCEEPDVRATIERTKDVDPDYWQLALQQRAGLTAAGLPNLSVAGSWYPGERPSEVERNLLNAEWKAYQHQNVLSPNLCFKADMPGLLGIVTIQDLPPGSLLKVDDRKHTGFASLTVHGISPLHASFSVIILKPTDNGDAWRVGTFHPGDPVRPSSIRLESLRVTTLTRDQAIELGFENAKIVFS